MKTIIAISNTSEKGKSTTILNLANLLISNYPNHKIIFCDQSIDNLTIDFRLIIEINGRIIALESQGDPGTELEKRLSHIINVHIPELIFCTCRTRGETVWAIDNIANKHSYNKIWTSTYQVTQNRKLTNALKAEHLLDLIIKTGIV